MSCRTRQIRCKDCIYGRGEDYCTNDGGAYFLTPIYEFDTCPYARKGTEDMDLRTTLFVADLSRIGIQLGNIRRKKKMTLTDVSKLSGVSISFLCKVEHGKCVAQIDTLLRWCKALGYEQVVFTRGCV